MNDGFIDGLRSIVGFVDTYWFGKIIGIFVMLWMCGGLFFFVLWAGSIIYYELTKER